MQSSPPSTHTPTHAVISSSHPHTHPCSHLLLHPHAHSFSFVHPLSSLHPSIHLFLFWKGCTLRCCPATSIFRSSLAHPTPTPTNTTNPTLHQCVCSDGPLPSTTGFVACLISYC